MPPAVLVPVKDPQFGGQSGVVVVDPDGTPVGDGGMNTTPVAAGTATDTVIKATPGQLGKVLITTLGANPLVIYDNATGHTGTIIGYIAASAVAGTLLTFNMSALNGITIQGNAANPAFTVSWA